jgi:hypothetical protein
MRKKSKIGTRRPRKPPLSRMPRPLRILGDDIFVKLEQAMYPAKLSEELRDRLSRQIFRYFSFSQHSPPKDAIVRKRLVSIMKAAQKLHQELNENPATVKVRVETSRILKDYKGGHLIKMSRLNC